MKNPIPVRVRDWLGLPIGIWQSWRATAEQAERRIEVAHQLFPERINTLPARAILAVLRWRAAHPRQKLRPSDSLWAWYAEAWGEWPGAAWEAIVGLAGGLAAAAVWLLNLPVTLACTVLPIAALARRYNARKWQRFNASRPAPTAPVAWEDMEPLG